MSETCPYLHVTCGACGGYIYDAGHCSCSNNLPPNPLPIEKALAEANRMIEGAEADGERWRQRYHAERTLANDLLRRVRELEAEAQRLREQIRVTT